MTYHMIFPGECAIEKNVYATAVEWKNIYIYIIIFILSIVQHFFMIFYLYDLVILESEILIKTYFLELP